MRRMTKKKKRKRKRKNEEVKERRMIERIDRKKGEDEDRSGYFASRALESAWLWATRRSSTNQTCQCAQSIEER